MANALQNILTDGWMILQEMAPYLLFGFLMAGTLSVLMPTRLIERHLGGRGFLSVVKAALIGIPLPLCSCSVIPVSMSLRRQGAGRGAVSAFLISTPQTGAESIAVTYSLLGPLFAIFTPLAAFVNGLLGGMAVTIWSGDDKDVPSEADTCSDSCCSPGNHQQNQSRLHRIWRYGFVTLPADIGRPLLLGLAIAAVISALVPDSFFAERLGTGFPAMLVMLGLGVPVYVCATASVPVAAALIMKGVSPGAALVFLMTGPATNAAAITTIWKVMGRRSTLIYLASVAITALAAGWTLDHITGSMSLAVTSGSHELFPAPIGLICALILLGILILNTSGIRRLTFKSKHSRSS